MIGPQDVVLEESLTTTEVPVDSNRFSDSQGLNSTIEPYEDENLLVNSPLIDELSASHVGQWNTLISQTNWEKGLLIRQWREQLITAEMPRAAYSDEAWARRVGNISSQHVGRLRRVSERFQETATGYSGLFWSHFQAALDWEDAEMWLEGAVQNQWSVAQMRICRWEAVGAPEELKPREEDVFTAEMDEDVNPKDDSYSVARTEARTAEIGPADIVEGFDSDSPAFADGDSGTKKEDKKTKKSQDRENVEGPSSSELMELLQNLSQDLPEDLSEALETVKIAVLNHKLSGWKAVAPAKVVKMLDTMKALVTSIDG